MMGEESVFFPIKSGSIPRERGIPLQRQTKQGFYILSIKRQRRALSSLPFINNFLSIQKFLDSL